MPETPSLISPLLSLLAAPRTGVLMLLLACAAASDLRSFRIPNALTFGGLALALLMSAWPAAGSPFGIGGALGGAATGLVMLLPFHALRVLGAGDVKLMAMAGAFLGAAATLHALLYVALAAGLAAGIAVIARGTARRTAANVRAMVLSLLPAAAHARSASAPAPLRSTGRLPFALAIAFGVLWYLLAAARAGA